MNRVARSFLIALVVLANLLISNAASAAEGSGAPLILAPRQGIAGQYIVVLKPTASTTARATVTAAGIEALHVYDAALNGFAAQLNDAQLAAIRRNPNVAYVEQDAVVTADTTQFMDPAGEPWGLDRIDQRNLPLNGRYVYTATASNVRAYIIDTGIRTTHTQFGSRALNVFDSFGGNGQDCNGHGTHVAGTVGGTTYGVAKRVLLRGVRVLDCSGSGSWAGVIAGVNWVANNRVRPAVANMSLGGGFNSAVNAAVTNLVNRGVFVAVAAGNWNINSCSVSPASTPSAYTTAASDRTDQRASFSDFGSCVDGYAPGVSIKSAWISSNTATAFLSGTSMASPHVAGVAALRLTGSPGSSPAAVTTWINSNASLGKIIGNPAGTPNRLLFKSTL